MWQHEDKVYTYDQLDILLCTIAFTTHTCNATEVWIWVDLLQFLKVSTVLKIVFHTCTTTSQTAVNGVISNSIHCYVSTSLRYNVHHY